MVRESTKYSTGEVALVFGVSRVTVWTWGDRPETAAEIEERIKAKEREVQALRDRWEDLRRREDPPYNGNQVGRVFGVTRQAVDQWRGDTGSPAAIESKVQEREAEVQGMWTRWNMLRATKR